MNKFDNDGSFLDQFIKEHKDKDCEQDNARERSSALQKPIKVTWKMKGQMGGIKKKSIATLMKEGSTKKAEDEEETVKTLTKEETNTRLKKEESAQHGLVEAVTKPKEGNYLQSPPSNKPVGVAKVTSASSGNEKERIKRKRKSRWGKELTEDEKAIASASATFSTTAAQPNLGCQLTPAQQRQLKEQQQMTAVVAQIRAAQHGKKNKYEYDSDEDTEGGTWEHKLRIAEMLATKDVAEQLTEDNKGKHHIGDFLPPEELEKFVEKVKAAKGEYEPDLSDYAKNKIDESNIGYQLLKNAGWTEGQGLGSNEDGITAPINKGKISFDQAGVGMEAPGEVSNADDEFDTYRKRMMLAYRFRPNPLNNPRRPYY